MPARPGAGRPKGTPNKPRKQMLDMLKSKFGADYDIIVEAAELEQELKGDMDRVTERLSAMALVARYTKPSLKQIDMKQEQIGERKLQVEFVGKESPAS